MTHERDSQIEFFEEGHRYKINGVEKSPTSVTTIIKNNFPAFDEEEVISKQFKRWNSDPTNRYYGMTKQQIKDEWERNRVEASSLGTEMHRQIELFLLGELETEPTTKEWGFFKEFWSQFQRGNPEAYIKRIEWVVFNEKKTVAGSIDAVVSTGVPGEVLILDWKRSKKIESSNGFGKYGSGPFEGLLDCNFIHYSIQLNMYKRILEMSYGLRVKAMFFLVFHPNNDSFLMYEALPMNVSHVID